MKSKWDGRTVGKDGERLMRNHKISKCYLDTELSMLNLERLVLGCSMPTCRIWPRFVYGHGVRMATSQNYARKRGLRAESGIASLVDQSEPVLCAVGEL